MKEKFLKILLNPKYIFGVYIIVAIATAFSKFSRVPQAINNYLIFKGAFYATFFSTLAFAENSEHLKDRAFRLPGFTVKNSGKEMVERFDTFVGRLKENGHTFGTFQEFQKQIHA